jgi:Glutaredoxin-like domain (DUF836)
VTGPATRLTVVHRRDCQLCDEMIAELTALARRLPLPPFEVVDVDSDPQLRRRHGLDVPVLLLDGSMVCRHRLDRDELLRLLQPAPGRAAASAVRPAARKQGR